MLHPPRRLFIGLIPDRPVQAQIQRHCRDWRWPETARPTRFGRYHLTLHFLGEVGVAPEMNLRQALRRVPVRPFELELGKPQLWRQGVAVLRPRDHPALQCLREEIAQLLPPVGLHTPTDFKPHVTLARNASGARPPAVGPCIVWPVSEFLLVWSRLPPEVKPARYELRERFGATGRIAVPGERAGGQQDLFG